VKRVHADLLFDWEQEQLLQLLGEELKRPLTHIAQLSQLGGKDHIIHIESQRALRTIDTVLLYKRLATGQLEMKLEPVHVGSVLAEVLHVVKPQMAISGCQSELSINASLHPVSADRTVLLHALVSLWQAYIASAKDATRINCEAKSVRGGVRITISSDEVAFHSLSFAKANRKSKQPVSELAGAATDLLVARGIFALSGNKLTISHLKTSSGIGVTLPISKQLQFV